MAQLVNAILTASFVFSLNTFAQLKITEVVISSGSLRDSDGSYSDWVEITNTSNQPVDLSQYYLSDKASEPEKWRFPVHVVVDPKTQDQVPFTLPPGNSIVVFCSDKDQIHPDSTMFRPEYHTNFKLDNDGQDVILLMGPNNEPIDGTSLTAMGLDEVYGRQYKRNGEQIEILGWAYIAGATPGRRNPTNESFYSPHPFVSEVKFAQAGGKLLGRKVVGVNHWLRTGTNQQVDIPITLKVMINGDGVWREVAKTEQNASQFAIQEDQIVLQDGPLALDPTAHNFPNPVVPLFQFPRFEGHDFTDLIYKDGYHLKAAGFIGDIRVTQEVSNSYFFGERAHALNLRIMSFHMNEIDYQRLMHQDFRKRGKKYEISSHFNIIDESGQVVYSARAGFRLHGNVARGGRRDNERGMWLKKGGKMYSGRAYGGRWDYPFFPDTDRQEYDELILRSSHTEGPYWVPYHTITRDQLARDLFWGMHGLAPAGDFYHLYVNGRYRGLYNPHERPSSGYFKHYLNEGNCEIIKSSAAPGERRYEVVDASKSEIEANRIDSITEIMTFLNDPTTNLNNEEDYRWLDERVDIANLMDYHLLNSFIWNLDWVGGTWNFYAYRKSFPVGKWRFLPWDLEFSWGPSGDPLRQFSLSIAGSTYHFIRALMSKLWRTPDYQRAFMNRASELIEVEGGALSEEVIVGHHEFLWEKVREDIDWQNIYFEPHWNPQWANGFNNVRREIRGQVSDFLQKIRERGLVSYLEVLSVSPESLTLTPGGESNVVTIRGRGFNGEIEVELDGQNVDYFLEFPRGVDYQLMHLRLPFRLFSDRPLLTIRRQDNGDEISGRFFSLDAELGVTQVSPNPLILEVDNPTHQIEIRGVGLHEQMQVTLDGIPLLVRQGEFLPHPGWESLVATLPAPYHRFSEVPVLRVEDEETGEVVEGQFFVIQFPSPYFLRGDLNGDGRVDVSDAISSIHHLFQNTPIPCERAADANADNLLNLTDALFLANYSFGNGPTIPAPFPECGYEGEKKSDRFTCERRAFCE